MAPVVDISIARKSRKSRKLDRWLGSRPIAIAYPGGHSGHCKTLRNALVAATRRLLVEKADEKATITYHDEVVADVTRAGSKLRVQWRVTWAEEGNELW